ncbi:MAG: response regulator [Lentimicrobium sp.]|nr:response regulator [Lentimicrobium sp.]
MRNLQTSSEKIFIEISALESAVTALSLKGMLLIKLNSDGKIKVFNELIHFYPDSARFFTSQYNIADFLSHDHLFQETGNENNVRLNWFTYFIKPSNQDLADMSVLVGVLTSSDEEQLACFYFKEGGDFSDGEKAYLVGIMELAAGTIRLKAAVELLNNEKIKFSYLFYAAPEAIAMLDDQNRVLDVNPAFERLFQYKKHELSGLIPEELISLNSKSSEKNKAEKKNPDGSRLASSTVLKRRDGKMIKVDIKNVPVDYGDCQSCKFRFYHEINNELTVADQAKKNAEVPFQKTINQDRFSDTFKSAFLAGISHEMRTPMNHILGFLDLLSEPDITSSEKADFMKIMKTSGMKLLNLIDDVIELGFIDSGQITLRDEKFNLNRFMLSLYEEAEKLKSARFSSNINLNLIIDKKFDFHSVISDEIRIRQIMINLISNALKFTQDGEIEIGYLIRNKKIIEFYVKDSGIGIDSKDQEVIFERFKKLENGITKYNTGVGLGLSICLGLASLFKSKILIDSTPGSGSTFSFSIPLVIYKAPVKIKHPLVSVNKMYDWSGKTVLIVEDDPVNMHFLKILLAKTQISILYAADGKQAVEIVQNQPVDIVLMDMNLPVLNGYESTRQIKKLRPDLPVIAQTAHAMRGDRMECIQAGCDEYLAKPLDMNKLYAFVDEFLKRG